MAQSHFLEWIALTPEKVEGDELELFRPVVEAFDGFKIEYEKGRETATLLKEIALSGWPEFITWVCWDSSTKQIDGFFCVGKTKLSRQNLKGDVPFDPAKKPASEIKIIRRHAHARLTEDDLVSMAIAKAARLWREVNELEVTIRLNPSGAKLHREHDFGSPCSDGECLWSRFPLDPEVQRDDYGP